MAPKSGTFVRRQLALILIGAFPLSSVAQNHYRLDEFYIASAAEQYETAARMDASEKNLFDLANDLLLHRVFEAAGKLSSSPRRSIAICRAASHARGCLPFSWPYRLPRLFEKQGHPRLAQAEFQVFEALKAKSK